jgi:RoxA-like, cytochrome c-like
MRDTFILRTLLLVLAVGFAPPERTAAPRAAPEARRAAAAVPIAAAWNGSAKRLLDQNWDAATREQFWFTSQGSQVIPYAWFLALEQADSTELFRSDAHMDALRYIPAPASGQNPDGLPIGFVKDVNEKDEWIGLTCAACHTGQIDYRGTSLIIDGAPGLGYADRLLAELRAALDATIADSRKFDRFAGKVLPRNPSPAKKAALLGRMRRESQRLDARVKASTVPWKDYPGFGRIDAFGQVYNQVELDLGVSGNAQRLDAPASYPFLWGIAQSDVVQWNGAGRNRLPSQVFPVGILMRNTLEVIGVFGRVDMSSAGVVYPPVYPSSVKLAALGRLEHPLCTLRAPEWPESLFGTTDTALAGEGEKIYRSRCIGCHDLVSNGQNYEVEDKLVPIEDVRTDPNLAKNAHDRRAKTGPLEGKLKNPTGETFGPDDFASEVAVNAVSGVLLHKPVEALQGVADSACVRGQPSGSGAVEVLKNAIEQLRQELATVPVKYKPRPLNGIWATAPYLHNGSVPTLDDLLRPAKDRPARFYVGNREFDPVKVGFRSDATPGTTELDTTLPGNHNTGHPYADGLNDTERRQLLEFLKTL